MSVQKSEYISYQFVDSSHVSHGITSFRFTLNKVMCYTLCKVRFLCADIFLLSCKLIVWVFICSFCDLGGEDAVSVRLT